MRSECVEMVVFVGLRKMGRRESGERDCVF